MTCLKWQSSLFPHKIYAHVGKSIRDIFELCLKDQKGYSKVKRGQKDIQKVRKTE
jgi:hypothetical protein